MLLWFAFDGVFLSVCDTELEALEEANAAFEYWKEKSKKTGDWDDRSNQVCCGQITHAMYAYNKELTLRKLSPVAPPAVQTESK